jgi:hypothetical protein
MCFGGGGESVEKMYEEAKPKFDPLPSLTSKRIERGEQVFKDVPKRKQRASLLSALTTTTRSM